MFGLLRKSGVRETLINDINDGETKKHQDEVVVSVQALAREALRQSGFSRQDAHSDAVTAAIAYAVHIGFAELRCDGLLPSWALDAQPIGVASGTSPHMEIRSRMGLAAPEPVNE